MLKHSVTLQPSIGDALHCGTKESLEALKEFKLTHESTEDLLRLRPDYLETDRKLAQLLRFKGQASLSDLKDGGTKAKIERFMPFILLVSDHQPICINLEKVIDEEKRKDVASIDALATQQIRRNKVLPSVLLLVFLVLLLMGASAVTLDSKRATGYWNPFKIFSADPNATLIRTEMFCETHPCEPIRE